MEVDKETTNLVMYSWQKFYKIRRIVGHTNVLLPTDQYKWSPSINTILFSGHAFFLHSIRVTTAIHARQLSSMTL